MATGDKLTVTTALLSRGGVALTLESLALEAVNPGGVRVLETRPGGPALEDNRPRRSIFTLTMPADAPLALSLIHI